ncbi:MAG: hypothetical protein CMJ85_05370 [Planctomycetes bacterium]|nr:hypothetical protein [Planctomycetota bacterium]
MIRTIASSGTSRKTCVVLETGQRTFKRTMRVAAPSPISWRCREPPKLLTLPAARCMETTPLGVSTTTSMRAPEPLR